MARIQIVGSRKRPGRCAYCRDALDALVRRCPGCGTWLHLDCLEELGGRCPTAGCARSAGAARPGRRERRERRRRHRRRRSAPTDATVERWADEERARPGAWARFGPYARLVVSGLVNLALLGAAVAFFGWLLHDLPAAWDALARTKSGRPSDANGYVKLALLIGLAGVVLYACGRWLWRWPRVWREVGRLLDETRPVPMRLRVWTAGSGKHKKTWAALRPLEGGGRRVEFRVGGLLPPGWLARDRDGTPVLVYGIEEPPYLIENARGQLALVHPD